MSTDPLVIINQESSKQEKYTFNGETKQVHVVIKEKPFMLIVGSSTIDLSKVVLVAKLIYDFDSDEEEKREVSYVKSPPLDFRVHVDQYGRKANVEVKIKVLTSQHEDMFFRVVVQAIEPVSKEHLDVISNPIRVVSKPGQLLKRRKVKAKKTTQDILSEQIPLSQSSNILSPRDNNNNNNNTLVSSLIANAINNNNNSPTSPVSSPSSFSPCCLQDQQNKRPLDVPAHVEDVNIAHTMSRLEEQQLLLQQLNRQSNFTIDNKYPQQQHSNDFEYLFQKLMDSYNNLPMEDRSQKIRKVIDTSSPLTRQNVSQFVGVLAREVSQDQSNRQQFHQNQLMRNTAMVPTTSTSTTSTTTPVPSCCEQDTSFCHHSLSRNEYDGLETPVYPDLFNVGEMFPLDFPSTLPLEMY